MPIYEYYSPDTNKIYAFFARGHVEPDQVPRCPDGNQHSMRKIMSGFAVIGRAKEPGSDDSKDLDDPRMEAAMAELEREMSGMDEENPDPRQMGRLMRRMADITGEKMPAAMEEMVGRLEAGEDPEKLEEEFGDMPELDDFGSSENDSGEDSLSSKSRALFRRMRGPRRDPELYELADYLD